MVVDKLLKDMKKQVADFKWGTGDAPPYGPIFIIFMRVWEKDGQIISWCPLCN